MVGFTIKLRVIQGQPAGKSLTFPAGVYYFGRGAECQIRPNSEWVSRQHCLLRITNQGAFLSDLGSRNGTLVNGVLVHNERRLLHGDHIQIGPLVFEAQIEAVPTSESPTLGAPVDTHADLHLAEDLPGAVVDSSGQDTNDVAPLDKPNR